LATSAIDLPSPSISSASRSFLTTWLGVWRFAFTVAGSSLPIVAGQKNSHTGRTDLRGSGHDYYNHLHRHSGIGLMTPATVHHDRAHAVHTHRARVLDAAYATNPDRFVRRAPTPPPVPVAAWINKPNNEEAAH